MNTPTYLKKGDKIAILCPAGYIKEDLTPAFDILRDWGLELEIYPSTYAQWNQFAGEDELRTKDLQQALDAPDIKAIIAGRGGYGSVRLIDKLDFSTFTKAPKWLVGFSDITVILSHIQNKLKSACIHGQMVKSFLDASPESLSTLKAALFGKNKDLHYTCSSPAQREGQAQGILTGGNLAILHSILASDSDVDYDGKILFIEDVGESYYNVDRMLWALKRAKKLNNLKGLIVGGFTSMKDSDPSFGQTIEEIIMDKVQEYTYPVAFGCPAGHIEDNRALVFGQEIELHVTAENVSIIYMK
ncbi:S66 peptidase family protein [Sphingobacterium yanglingense]|uniref:Muramoyltetrapeptide carboxypeptidase n=1 Tax=Sphingobacterium yanglingense TaxID=1437280 RepID=A0A4V3DDB4_9SPHI|nr:LD-carboxypeptidase [Sphingobacterium yanglingense]TDQ75710.1 muramoyltetrapeptide carboxypeptidase [Sphingobacterium yanglingense]